MVRSGPSTSYGKYGALVCGAELQVEGIENGWAKVSYNGKTAYVSASYIKESWVITSQLVAVALLAISLSSL